MDNNKLSIRDIMEADGTFGDFIVSKNKMIAFVFVEALNLDLEDEYVIKNILKSYSTFLYVLKSRDESIMNITMAAKNDTEQYILYWKRKLLEVDEREDLTEEAKVNVKQLIASKIIDIENHVRLSESFTKQHFMVMFQAIEGKAPEDYELAEKRLQEKCNAAISEMHEWMRNCNRDVDIKTADIQEALKVLQHFIDNKAAMLS